MVYFNLQPRAAVNAVNSKNKGDAKKIEKVPKVKNMSLENRSRDAPQRHPYADLSSHKEGRYRCEKITTISVTMHILERCFGTKFLTCDNC